MRRHKTTPLIAAGLAAFLTGCETLPGESALAVNEPGSLLAVARAIAPACPAPTAAARLRAIQAELEAGIKARAAPDALAEEWERLDQAARICRGMK
jgi:hypothetical protein